MRKSRRIQSVARVTRPSPVAAGPDTDGAPETTAAVSSRNVARPFVTPADEGDLRGGDDRVPTLAEGTQLLGEYEGSGFRESPFMVRTSGGQMVQLPPLLYFIVEQLDGRSTYDRVAAKVSDKSQRGVTADNIRYLLDEKIRTLGLLEGAPARRGPAGILALRLKFSLVPPRAVRILATLLRPLLWPPVIALVLTAFIAMDVWLFGVHGVAQSLRQSLYEPRLMLLVLGLVVSSAAFHELGHATACSYGGAKPGAIGAGFYVAWPAFFTDVTDSYRLGRAGRVRTDLGGVYFNAIFSLATLGVYFGTGLEALLLVIVVQHIEILHQFMPFLRLDGYYVISDLTGVPDMFSRIRPILRSLIPWRKTDNRVKELKPWVRLCVTGWVLITIPLLVFQFGAIAFAAPRIFATTGDSISKQAKVFGTSFEEGSSAGIAMAAVQMAIVSLPVAGMTMSFGMTFKRLGKAGLAWTAGKPVVRAAFVTVATGTTAIVGYIWLPNGDYVPIHPHEKGTIQEGIMSFTEIPGGRPGLITDSTTNRPPLPSSTPAPTPTSSTTPAPGTSPAVGGEVPASSPSPTVAPSPSPTGSPEPSPSPSPSPSGV